jgi:uncharacterized protein YukE
MTLSAATENAQIDASMGAVVLLSSSCQAVIEAEIQGGGSSWYPQLDAELGAAENLVLAWRQSGVLYFKTDILQAIARAGTAFTSAQPDIDALVATLKAGPSAAAQAQLVAALEALQPPVQAIVDQADVYLAKLQAFEEAMEVPHGDMETTIAQVQAQETDLQAQITAINAEIASLDTQIQVDRDAISKAEAKRTSGIIETIFGVLLTPFTGGASLILAGIGVASIAEAQSLISGMESQISTYQQTIAGDQSTLSSDQQVIVTLNGLTLSTGMVLADMDRIAAALDALRLGWTAYAGELGDVVAKLVESATAPEVILAQAWYDAACIEWAAIVDHVSGLLGAGLTSTRVQIG